MSGHGGAVIKTYWQKLGSKMHLALGLKTSGLGDILDTRAEAGFICYVLGL